MRSGPPAHSASAGGEVAHREHAVRDDPGEPRRPCERPRPGGAGSGLRPRPRRPSPSSAVTTRESAGSSEPTCDLAHRRHQVSPLVRSASTAPCRRRPRRARPARSRARGRRCRRATRIDLDPAPDRQRLALAQRTPELVLLIPVEHAREVECRAPGRPTISRHDGELRRGHERGRDPFRLVEDLPERRHAPRVDGERSPRDTSFPAAAGVHRPGMLSRRPGACGVPPTGDWRKSGAWGTSIP